MAYVITRFVLFENEGALKAFCDVSIDGRFLIKGIRIIEGRSGPFVSMPRQQNKDGKWFDSVVPLTKETKHDLARVVLSAYHDSAAATRTQAQVNTCVNVGMRITRS